MAWRALRASDRHFVLKKRRAPFALVAAFAFAALLPGSARAGDIDAARRLMAEGVKLFQRGDYEGARRLFKKADGEHHAAPIVYNLGLAEERSGRPQAAVDAYEAYVAETGDAGEFTASAVVAIAQIKARSTRLRVETKPAGARLFVDASTLTDTSPTTLLVPAGRHVVVAQGDGWRGEHEVEAKGGGEALTILIVPPVAAEAVAPAVSQAPVVAPEMTRPPVVSSEVDRTPTPPESGKPDGFVWGVSFALTPYHLQGAPGAGAKNAAGTTQAVAGAILEAGHAVTDRFEFLARGFVALGPEAKPTFAWMGGPAVSLRLGSSLWLGATFIGGGLTTRAHDERYGTGLVFGTMVEATLAVIATPYGQWTVGLQPGLLLTSDVTDNTAFFLPITFGYRAY